MKTYIALIQTFDRFNLFARTTAGKGAIVLVMGLAQIPAIAIFAYGALSVKLTGFPVPDYLHWGMSVSLALAYELIIYSLAINGEKRWSIFFAALSLLMSASTWAPMITLASFAGVVQSIPGLFFAVLPPGVIALYSHLLAVDYAARKDMQQAEQAIAERCASNILDETLTAFQLADNARATEANKQAARLNKRAARLQQKFNFSNN